VNRRLVLVGEFIDGQSGGHGVTPIDLSLKSGEAQIHTGRFGPLNLQPWYSLLLGALTMVVIGSGLALLLSSGRSRG
jgi:hypothetical protein